MLTGQIKMAGSSASRIFRLPTVTQFLAAVPSRSFAGSACRLLYTKEALGMNGYENTRERTATQLGSMKERFKTRMEQYLTADSKSLIFTEDLKNMLYLADTNEDLSMVEKMMKKFVKQNEQLRFGSFVFGPVVMRMFHHLDKPDEALKAIQDPELAAFFDQLTSYHVLMDLLYTKQRYGDVLKLYNVLTERPFFAGRFPKECLVLAVASLHKQGTKEAYEECKRLIKSATDANAPVMRKAVAYAADLALKNDDAAGCLEMLSIANNQQYVSIRNLKALALLKLDRLEDVLPILRSVLEQDVAYGQKRTQPSFFGDVVAQIKEALEKKGDKELQHEFEKVFQHLETASHLDDSKMATFLEREIEDSKPRLGMQSGGQGGQGGRSFGGGYQQQDRFGGQGGQRQARYSDDSRQEGGSRYGGGGGGGGGGYRSQNRPAFGQDGRSQQGRSDMFSGGDVEGQESTGGYGSGGGGGGFQRSGGYQRRENSSYQSRGGARDSDASLNEEAGYRPTSNYQRNRGLRGSGGGGGESDRYNGNAEAGYKPRSQYQRNAGGSGSPRQGLQDLDD